MRALRVAVSVVTLGALAGLGPSAVATHEGDDIHSANMSLVTNVATGRGGELAFWRDTAVLAHGATDGDPRNDGFVLLDISTPSHPRKIGEFTCVGSAYDVGIWRDLVFLSVSVPVKGTDCDADRTTREDPQAFAGIRVVSIEDPARPVQLTAVPTNMTAVGSGSHTHTLLPDLDHRDARDRKAPRILVYVSGVAPEEIVEVPLRRPADAKVISWIDTEPSQGCHDVSFFVERRLATCNGIQPDTMLWDVSNPERPRVVGRIVNPLVAHHHSSAFSSDGDTLMIVDENAANLVGEKCQGGTPSPTGVMWFYDISNPSIPVLLSYYQLPQPVPDRGCTAHQFNVVPLKSGRDVLVAGWYGGGTTVVDFTDVGPANPPRQIAYYIADVDDPDQHSFPWSSYWYNGHIYANHVKAFEHGLPGIGSDRGFDVFSIRHPALRDAIPMRSFNFGLQEEIRTK
ncbi:MAG TPA: hypothetical protein VHL78_10440 [Actinomycetota bacterium]|nr:hypothetical protein [Actinomycetota bacterium]